MTFLSTDLIRASARMNYSVPGPDLVNVMYFEMVSPSSLADALLVADIGQALEVIYAAVKTTFPTSLVFTDITVKNETQDTAPIVSSWPTFSTGDSTADPFPSQNAGLVVARTNVSRKQGRVYISGNQETGADGNAWAGGVLSNLTAFAAQLLVTHIMTSGNFRYGVASVAVAPPRNIANSFDVPISTAVIPFVRTQRRRSQGFGS